MTSMDCRTAKYRSLSRAAKSVGSSERNDRAPPLHPVGDQLRRWNDAGTYIVDRKAYVTGHGAINDGIEFAFAL